MNAEVAVCPAEHAALEHGPAAAARRSARELPPDAIKRPDARARRLERAVLLGITGVPLLGAAGGIALFVAGGVGLADHLVFASLYCLTGFGITIGYHRLLAHRAFRTSPGLRGALAIAGAMAIQGPAMRWVADHRRHHGFTDRAGDPHSPWRDAPAHGRAARRLAYAHLGWFFDAEKTTVRRFAPDLIADPTVARIDRLYPLWMVLSLAVPSALGLALGGARGAYHGFVWGGLTRICIVQHVTWSINSLAHAFGTRPFDTPDQSRNNRLLSWLALGEGLHNNHHAFPRAAIQSLHAGEVDPSGLVLRALERLGLVWDLRRATPDHGTRHEHP